MGDTIKTMGQDKINETRVQLGEQARNVHRVIAVAGTTLEQILNPEYWSHIAKNRLRIYDLIEVLVEDGSAYYELLVVSVGRTEAHVALKLQMDLQTVAQGALSPSDYSIKWSGPHTKHRVLRGTDVIKDGFESKEYAEQWLKNHLQVQKVA